MRSVLIAAVLSTIIASNSSAQKFPTKPERSELTFAKDSAQRADSTAIMLAVADSGGRGEWITLVGDTAWVVGSTEKRLKPDTTRKGDVVMITDGVAFDHWQARVERRKGKWVQVSRRRL
jgi:hypothetical protein